MKKFSKSRMFTFGTYLLLVLTTVLIGLILLQNNSTLNHVIRSFFDVAENRSFDYRQTIKVMHKQPLPNKDIVVLAIDDASLELLWDKYGEWPIPRYVYADMINFIEKDNPQAIIFDMMFIKSIRGDGNSDKKLTDTMNKYNNIYTAMNFDYVTTDVRLPIDLPDRLSVNLDNKSNIEIFKKYSFSNCRPILKDLIEGKTHIGITNIVRNSDGIIRKVAPLLMYKGKYYPYLSFGAAANYLTSSEYKDFEIDNNGNLKIQDTVLPLTKEGDVVLNWYGISGTHAIYPMHKLLNDMNSKRSAFDSYNFKDKIVIVGTTAVALHDTKSVPIQDAVYPGVEVHATFFNNMLDNNFIRQTDFVANLLIVFAVICIVGFIVMMSTSTIFALLSTILFGIAYVFISYYAMAIWNLWIPVVIPLIAVIIAFSLSFLAKYIIKSRDFDYQYKLATVDGLTELYNHRYFQDALRNQIEISKRYQQKFSLIIIDIDYFKNFNDKYGHQAGDAVLRQVAQTLKKNSRTTDIVCRYGGEEMSIILPNTDKEEALFNANRIRKAVEENQFHLNESNTANVTISLGVSTYPDNAESPQDLIEFADKGLYYAKNHGRNCVGVTED